MRPSNFLHTIRYYQLLENNTENVGEVLQTEKRKERGKQLALADVVMIYYDLPLELSNSRKLTLLNLN